MPNINDKLLAAIKARGVKQEPFAYGIIPADRYVRTMLECAGSDICNKTFGTQTQSFHDALTKSANVLTYSNPEMVVDKKHEPSGYAQAVVAIKQMTDEAIELPPNTLMVFRHVLTTPRKDRDNDVLRTEGATVDPKMPLLWQHVHTLPIGKMLVVAQHDATKLVLISAIIDINELSHDAAVMIDNDMGRFSHGFRALEFSELKEEEGETTSPGGFDITKFEIMEESIVSVPSNVDAETEEVLLSLVESGKLTSGIMKETGRAIREKRPVQSAGGYEQPAVVYTERVGEVERTIETRNAADFENVFKQTGERNAIVAGNGSGTPAVVGNAITGGKGKGIDCSCTSAEANGKTTTEATTPEDAEVKRAGLPLKGSWEDIEAELRTRAQPFLASMGVMVGMNDFVWLAGTFSDHAVICVEKPEVGVVEEFRYFKAEWELADGDAKFRGDPQPVDIVTSVEIMSRSTSNKLSNKVGRVLSRANMKLLHDVREDIDELRGMDSLNRGATAICERCINKLTDVIRAAGGDDEEETEHAATAKDAAAVFLVKATPTDRKDLLGVLQAFEVIETANERGKQFRAFTGAKP